MHARFLLHLVIALAIGWGATACARATPRPAITPVTVPAPTISASPNACAQAPNIDSLRMATQLADSARAQLLPANARATPRQAAAAAQLFVAAANLNPCDEWFYVDGARAYGLAGAPEYSLTMLRSGVSLIPGSGQLWYELAERLHELGRLKEACAAVRSFRARSNQRVARACV